MFNAKYFATTPKVMSPEITAFCQHLEPSREPEWLETDEWPFAKVGQCYFNVEAFIAENGGEVQYGWIIWELPGIYLTAEHHAVAKKGNGLIDGTPQINGERKTIFLPSDQVWSGKPILNKYQAIRDTPLADWVCELQRRNSVLYFRGLFGSPEHRRNDNECCLLIDKFYEIKKQRERQRRAKQKRR